VRRSSIVLGASFALLVCIVAAGLASDRNILWQVVNNLCVRSERTAGMPFPCQQVDLEKDFALIKAGRAHLLLIPTARIEGIESPELLARGAPNYWEYAWEARDHLDKVGGDQLTRDKIGLAVNSRQGRTQDQLHIHIGCLRPDVRAALQVDEPDISRAWSKLPFAIGGDEYRIMRVDGDTLGATNPFELVADGIPAARRDMASQTIVVAGMSFGDGGSGFYVLTARSQGSYPATGESLLDYQCLAARG
jgi:CDP-diacylglycerol pyrophosphatase